MGEQPNSEFWGDSQAVGSEPDWDHRAFHCAGLRPRFLGYHQCGKSHTCRMTSTHLFPNSLPRDCVGRFRVVGH